MKDPMHADSEGFVVTVQGGGVLRTVRDARVVGRGEDGFDHVVAQHHQCRQDPEAGWHRLIAARHVNAAHELFATKLFQIVRRSPRPIRRGGLPTEALAWRKTYCMMTVI